MKNIEIKHAIVRINSEFNLQVLIFNELAKELKHLGFSVFGEVRLLDKYRPAPNKPRKIKARLDIAVFKKKTLICAIEVKRKRSKGARKQIKKYKDLGIPKVFLCKNFKDTKNIICFCKRKII